MSQLATCPECRCPVHPPGGLGVLCPDCQWDWDNRDLDEDDFPATPEAVAAAEAEFDESAVVLPSSLSDPMWLLERPAIDRLFTDLGGEG